MKQIVECLRPEAFDVKYIVVRDYGDGKLRWSGMGSDDYALVKKCVDYINTFLSLRFKMSIIETKDVIPASVCYKL